MAYLPKIVDFYTDFEPPEWVNPAVTMMAGFVPAHYLNGLERVVLTNKAGWNRERRRMTITRRKRKTGMMSATGAYHPRWKNEPAYIELFIDSILSSSDRVLRLRFFREQQIARVFYHELGHHIHKTNRPEFREPEDVADDWSKTLAGKYLRNRFPWMIPIAFTIRTFIFPLVAKKYRIKD